METYGFIESFTDLEDAYQFMDHKILEFYADGWILRDTSGLERIGPKWRVGLVFIKEKEAVSGK